MPHDEASSLSLPPNYATAVANDRPAPAPEWRQLLRSPAVRKLLEAFGTALGAFVAFAALGYWWAQRLAHQIEAAAALAQANDANADADADASKLDPAVAALETLQAQVASSFNLGALAASAIDATLGWSLVADLRRDLAERLADLARRRRRALASKEDNLAQDVATAQRRRDFAARWKRQDAKSLSMAELEALLAEARDVESEFAGIIREWIDLQRRVARESATLRLTSSSSSSPNDVDVAAGDEGDLEGTTSVVLATSSSSSSSLSASRLTESAELRLFRAVTADFDFSLSEGRDNNNANESEEDVVVVPRGERNAAKRRSGHAEPLGAHLFDDYDASSSTSPSSSIARELARQTQSQSVLRMMELRYRHDLLALAREDMRRKVEAQLEARQAREDDLEARRVQSLRELEARRAALGVERARLRLQRRQARRALDETEARAAWSGLRTRMSLHAGVYGAVALYHMWHGLLESWRARLDLSSLCSPAIPYFVGPVCLPNLTAWLPLHVLLPLALSLMAVGLQCGGFFIQMSCLGSLGIFLAVILSQVPSLSDFLGLAVVLVAQLVLFGARRVLARVFPPSMDDDDADDDDNESEDGDDGGRRARARRARRTVAWAIGAGLTAAEALVLAANVGLALAIFARRRKGAFRHDSLADCFATPSDVGDCFNFQDY